MKRHLKAILKQVDQINAIIHTRNLFLNGRRYINAHIVDGKIVVDDLYGGPSVEFGDGFTDGNRNPVSL